MLERHMRRLEDRIAVVVGAGQTVGETMGNGRATAITFAREGARLVLVDRERSSLEVDAAPVPLVPKLEGLLDEQGELLPGAFVYRTIGDCLRMRDYARPGDSAVVVAKATMRPSALCDGDHASDEIAPPGPSARSTSTVRPLTWSRRNTWTLRSARPRPSWPASKTANRASGVSDPEPVRT